MHGRYKRVKIKLYRLPGTVSSGRYKSLLLYNVRRYIGRQYTDIPIVAAGPRSAGRYVEAGRYMVCGYSEV